MPRPSGPECRPGLRNHGVGWGRRVERLRNGGVPQDPVFLMPETHCTSAPKGWGGMVLTAHPRSPGGWVCQQAGGYGLEVGCASLPYHTPQKVQTLSARFFILITSIIEYHETPSFRNKRRDTHTHDAKHTLAKERKKENRQPKGGNGEDGTPPPHRDFK